MNIITLILAIIAVESSGNDLAVGDNGDAYGCLQIHACYVQDASEYAKEDRLGRPVTIEDIARIHNGGPNGYKKDATIKYWKKVEAELISRGAIASYN